ncbi:hypothetical protein KUTeg_022584 [Tegillarca granosa]|uniref:Uncharacterized protein n=1 Tax=Tegillarca granosa TaxID=220873 RepID=A0ABQ9E7H7_TEGGR|nr:hypothetical protein KUTeg_022584 [Tegillarca granosa]
MPQMELDFSQTNSESTGLMASILIVVGEALSEEHKILILADLTKERFTLCLNTLTIRICIMSHSYIMLMLFVCAQSGILPCFIYRVQLKVHIRLIYNACSAQCTRSISVCRDLFCCRFLSEFKHIGFVNKRLFVYNVIVLDLGDSLDFTMQYGLIVGRKLENLEQINLLYENINVDSKNELDSSKGKDWGAKQTFKKWRWDSSQSFTVSGLLKSFVNPFILVVWHKTYGKDYRIPFYCKELYFLYAKLILLLPKRYNLKFVTKM